LRRHLFHSKNICPLLFLTTWKNIPPSSSLLNKEEVSPLQILFNFYWNIPVNFWFITNCIWRKCWT
jgi:hypothetical protein